MPKHMDACVWAPSQRCCVPTTISAERLHAGEGHGGGAWFFGEKGGRGVVARVGHTENKENQKHEKDMYISINKYI